MKHSHYLITLILLALAGTARANPNTDFIATVTGNVAVNEALSPTTFRVLNTPLNTKRIFEEYGASPKDYELVLNAASSDILQLIPKSASANLQTFTIFTLSHLEVAEDSKLRIVRLFASVSSTAPNNVFTDLVGAFNGGYMFGVGSNSTTILKPVFKLICGGTNVPGSPNNPSALLNFKIIGGKHFVQAP